MLSVQQPEIIQVALDGLQNILEVGEQDSVNNADNVNPFSLFIEEAHGMDRIYQLQHHENELIYLKSKTIIDKYFGPEEDVDEIGTADDEFNFNAQSIVPQGGFNF